MQSRKQLKKLTPVAASEFYEESKVVSEESKHVDRRRSVQQGIALLKQMEAGSNSSNSSYSSSSASMESIAVESDSSMSIELDISSEDTIIEDGGYNSSDYSIKLKENTISEDDSIHTSNINNNSIIPSDESSVKSDVINTTCMTEDTGDEIDISVTNSADMYITNESTHETNNSIDELSQED
jgi:hypothetical protein